MLTAKIGDLQVNTAKIANLAVGSAQIAVLSVLTANIANLNVTTGKIANLAVTAAQIADATITTAKIGSAQITSALIGSAQIISALIGALAVGTAAIQDSAITNAKIADATIQSAKIANLTFDKMIAGTLNAIIDMGTGLIRFTIGGNKLTMGKGFGTSNQFIMWFGPDQDESLMSEGAAIFYLKTNGDAYFGGTLSAGTIYNAGSSTLASDTGFVLGPFSSSGHLITYNVDIDLSGQLAASTTWDEVNGDTSGRPPDPYAGSHHTITATYTFDKSTDGVSWTNIATFTDTRSSTSQVVQVSRTLDSPSPGDITRHMQWQHNWAISIHQTGTITLAVGSTDRLRITRTAGVTDVTAGTTPPFGGIQAARHAIREVEQ